MLPFSIETKNLDFKFEKTLLESFNTVLWLVVGMGFIMNNFSFDKEILYIIYFQSA